MQFLKSRNRLEASVMLCREEPISALRDLRSLIKRNSLSQRIVEHLCMHGTPVFLKEVYEMGYNFTHGWHLQSAFCHANYENLEFLLSVGSRPRNEIFSCTSTAIERSSYELVDKWVDILIEHGAKIYSEDGPQALSRNLMSVQDPRGVKLLLEKGCNPNWRDYPDRGPNGRGVLEIISDSVKYSYLDQLSYWENVIPLLKGHGLDVFRGIEFKEVSIFDDLEEFAIDHPERAELIKAITKLLLN